MSDADLFFQFLHGQGFGELVGLVGVLVVVSIATTYLILYGTRASE